MRKTAAFFILLAGALTVICFGLGKNAKADDMDAQPANQVLNDEGYGNDDAEYNNSEDDRANVEDTSSRKNSSDDD